MKLLVKMFIVQIRSKLLFLEFVLKPGTTSNCLPPFRAVVGGIAVDSVDVMEAVDHFKARVRSLPGHGCEHAGSIRKNVTNNVQHGLRS